MSVYRGICPDCRRRIETNFKAPKGCLPPPTLMVVHQCARPPVSVVLDYEGER